VRTLSDGRLDEGERRVTFDGSPLPSGIYFVRLAAGDATRTQKMVMVKWSEFQIQKENAVKVWNDTAG